MRVYVAGCGSVRNRSSKAAESTGMIARFAFEKSTDSDMSGNMRALLRAHIWHLIANVTIDGLSMVS